MSESEQLESKNKDLKFMAFAINIMVTAVVTVGIESFLGLSDGSYRTKEYRDQVENLKVKAELEPTFQNIANARLNEFHIGSSRNLVQAYFLSNFLAFAPFFGPASIASYGTLCEIPATKTYTLHNDQRYDRVDWYDIGAYWLGSGIAIGRQYLIYRTLKRKNTDRNKT